MRFYAGISLTSGRPYAGIGTGFSLRGSRPTVRSNAQTKADLAELRRVAEETKKAAAVSNAKAAYDGLLGLDAMLDARR